MCPLSVGWSSIRLPSYCTTCVTIVKTTKIGCPGACLKRGDRGKLSSFSTLSCGLPHAFVESHEAQPMTSSERQACVVCTKRLCRHHYFLQSLIAGKSYKQGASEALFPLTGSRRRACRYDHGRPYKGLLFRQKGFPLYSLFRFDSGLECAEATRTACIYRQ